VCGPTKYIFKCSLLRSTFSSTNVYHLHRTIDCPYMGFPFEVYFISFPSASFPRLFILHFQTENGKKEVQKKGNYIGHIYWYLTEKGAILVVFTNFVVQVNEKNGKIKANSKKIRDKGGKRDNDNTVASFHLEGWREPRPFLSNLQPSINYPRR